VNNIAKLGTAAAVAALAMGVAGCGSSSSGTGGGSGTSTLAPAAATKAVAASTLQTKSTKIGTVLVSSKGLTIYELVGDTATNQKCDSSCQAFWPPVTSGGSQLVINGHPAFTFEMDSAPGQVHGQNSKDTWGTWLALDASGNPISASTTTPAPKSSATSSSGSGGYGY
jgi:predicted lipoprotein with Yx(FWY)xxD motif